jgi:hypothetical protein
VVVVEPVEALAAVVDVVLLVLPRARNWAIIELA